MKKSTTARLERLRKARSINDVLAIMKEIASEVKTGNKVISSLLTSLSATKRPSAADLQEIVIDHGGAAKPTRVKVGSKSPTMSKLGVKLEKFVAPPMDMVKKHYTVISDLHDNATELEAAEALVRQTFAKAKNQKPVLAALKALRAEVDGNLQKAFAALDVIAAKHLPTEMENLGDALVSFMIDHLNPKSYTNMNKEVYVSPDAEGNIVFSLYVAIHDLKNKSGFVFEEYYAILTGVVNSKGVINYFLNTLPEFKVPGKYPIGKEVGTTTEMLSRISILFAHNEIMSDLERKPMALDTQRAKTGGFITIPNVDDTYVLDDALYVIITKGKESPKTINAIVVKVIPLLNQLTGNTRRDKGAISYRPVQRKGHTVLQFIITPSVKNAEHTLNVARLKEVQDLLDLSDKEVHAIKTILHGK